MSNLALKNLAIFFSVLLILTIIARGTAGATIPAVSITHPSYGNTTSTVQANGSISSTPGQPFFLPEGLVVQEVYTTIGSTVAPGDALVAFNSREVELTIAQKQAEIEKMQLQSSQLAAGTTADPFTVEQAQDQLLRAYAECHKTDDNGQQEISDAEQALESAQNDLLRLQNNPPASLATPEQSNPSTDYAYTKWQADVESARLAVSQMSAALESAKEKFLTETEAALSAAQSTEDRRNSAINSYENSVQATQKQNDMDAAEAKIVAAQMNSMRYELELLRDLQENQYKCLASEGGIVTDLNVTPGESCMVVGGLIAAQDANCILTVELTKKESLLLTDGIPITVTQGDHKQQISSTIFVASPENDTVVLTAAFPRSNWQLGAASVSITIQGASSGLCLPLSAINTDSQGNFVYLVEEKNSVLGLQNVLIRTPVSILQQGDLTAVVSGAIDEGSNVVSSSSKPLSAGTYVRVQI